ncbi:CPBP family intramembrane glutamic endopeptidase [Paenibacillus sp.]|uniref:CPBP family intramembrane glutamic endopeptidase n=1 Tax=Paenibacillus sp. TaxID=58172 RepID=UPI002D72601F|nr:CPBP family intramembrane glutamic endopeptidase [Paenibacillus sp.]HZG86487.1 CPBP family intramembrane glutamic endopeptidase [Paenibacillus sp.]
MLKALGKVAFAAVVFLALNVIVSIPLGIVGGIIAAMQSAGPLTAESITELMMSHPLLKTAAFSLSAAAGVGTAALLYHTMEKDRSWSLGWKQERWFPKLVAGLVWGAALITLCYLIVLSLGGIRVAGTGEGGALALLLALDVIVFAAVAIGEETFSRGYVYGVVKRQGGIAAAVAVSSLLFALLHANNAAVFETPFPMLNLTLAGVMLALFREWSGGLWLPIGVHLTWNYFQGDVLGMAVSGVRTPSLLEVDILDPFLAGGDFGLEGSFVTTLVMLAVSAWLWLRIRRRSRLQNG